MGTDKPIMLVCSDNIRSSIIANCLIRAGVNAERIVKVKEINLALANLMGRNFAMVVSDHNGGINGVELLNEIRNSAENGEFKSIPFIIIAKRGTPEDIREAGRLGITAFILFDPPLDPKAETDFLYKLEGVLTGWLI